MGNLARWILEQVRKAPGEWIRGRVIDQIIDFVARHWLVSTVTAVLTSAGGVWAWFSAQLQHDPLVAVLIGLGVAVLILMIIVIWIVNYLRDRLSPMKRI